MVPGGERGPEVVSISDVRLEGVAGTRLGTPSRLTTGRTPTPTWTEGTPSYTESSYSGDTGQYHPLPPSVQLQPCCSAFPSTPTRSLATSKDSVPDGREEVRVFQETEMVSTDEV